MNTRWILPAALLLGVAFACGGPPPPPIPPPPEDSGVVLPPDGGEDDPDAGTPSDPDAGPDAGTPDAGLPDAGLPPLSFTLSSGDLNPPFSEDVTSYELTSFTLLQPVTLTVEGATRASVDGVPVQDGVPYTLPPQRIEPGRSITVTLNDLTYDVQLWPTQLAQFTTTASGPLPGEILLTPPPYLLILDEQGAVRFYRELPAPAWDFKRYVFPGGVVRYSYIMEGDGYVLDEDLQPVGSWRPLATSSHPSYPQDNHEFELLGPDHVLMSAYVDRTVTNIPAEIDQADGGSRVISGFVQEVDQGQVVFEWDSTEHPELYALSSESNDFEAGTADYAHLNSVAVDPFDGNLLLSFRHLDCVLKVDRHTGAILWRLGGPNDSFRTEPEQRSSHQHFARMIAPDRLQLFDNGNANQESRLLTYDLDPVNGTLSGFQELELGYFTMAMGSVQQLSPNALFVGLGLPTQAGTPGVLEYDLAKNKQTFSLIFTTPGIFSYRALKYP